MGGFSDSARPGEVSTESSLRCWTPSGLRSIKYTDPEKNSGKPILLCVPGIARTHRDFGYLAAAARKHFRVVCVTLLGMGASERLPSAADYRSAGWDLHISCLVTLISHLSAQRLTFVGTSLGGIFGLILAAQERSPISALVLNDIGAFAAKENFVGFNEALASDVRFGSVDHAEKYLKIAYRAIGALSGAQWREFTLDSIEATAGGQFRLSYDPNIARQFIGTVNADLDLWDVWKRVRCPTLIVRGHNSQFLTELTVKSMLEDRENCVSVTLPDCGHFPHLRTQEHTSPIIDWVTRQMVNEPQLFCAECKVNSASVPY
jgi:pimeloyl-ACP methyl ester carboxylesterase